MLMKAATRFEFQAVIGRLMDAHKLLSHHTMFKAADHVKVALIEAVEDQVERSESAARDEREVSGE